ncbi:hypothetical protein [Pseudomonas entomophila]|uniref:hypothetical protein n=1 Tax=Pseudomonas entomophila TaxID=312306 RepID=UPI001EFFF68F|nr:hypothetical protein [Pseudomonas entomophila]MCG8291973.1 hypothetical protein [Pseudomonas entomophila]
MDIASIPPTVFVAFGVITAALLTGVFSITNMVSAKENKVSEFRLAWIDGLRNEIAEYASAAQEISRAYNPDRFKPLANHSPEDKQKLQIEFYKETREAYARAVENLTKIQLRLNPVQIEKNPDSDEAKLMAVVLNARKMGNKSLAGVIKNSNEIRLAAAPILKSTWSSVKRGEPSYRNFRSIAIITVTLGFYTVIFSASYIGYNTYKAHEKKTQQEQMKRVLELEEKFQEGMKRKISPTNDKPH